MTCYNAPLVQIRLFYNHKRHTLWNYQSFIVNDFYQDLLPIQFQLLNICGLYMCYQSVNNSRSMLQSPPSILFVVTTMTLNQAQPHYLKL